ncbi:MAG: hypothetical protein EKK48_08595 [Candidatus Melainabacteria bacterium]|nr:MAG: hypothetical protein EKK48_08595 [Candidatus Melainabacteria bacterium]
MDGFWVAFASVDPEGVAGCADAAGADEDVDAFEVELELEVEVVEAVEVDVVWGTGLAALVVGTVGTVA